jgi:hypothetical protein
MKSLGIFLLCSGTFVLAAALHNNKIQQSATPIQPLTQSTRLPDSPRYWKGNLHTHSLWSDGDDFPEMITDWYKNHDYNFLALSEHNVIAEGEKWVDATSTATRNVALQKYVDRFGTRWVEQRVRGGQNQVRLKPLAEFRSLLEEPGRFLMIPAEEITHSYGKRPIHINGINLRDTIQPLDGLNAIETVTVNLRQVSDQSRKTNRAMIAFLNHPNFGWGLRAEEMLITPELKFFEVYNGHPGVRNYGDTDHASCERVWDITLALRLGQHGLPIVYGLATDDAHGYHEYGIGKVNPGRGWVMVKSSHLTAESIVKSLEKGEFYSSTGVQLDEVARQGDTIQLKIRGEPGVTYKTQFISTLKGTNLFATPKTVKDSTGKEEPVTGDYSPEIGKVIAESNDLRPMYKLTGDELYVRAKVISSKPHPNPYAKGDVEVAWTQPIVP